MLQEPVHPLVQSYAERFSSPEEPMLRQVSDDTYASHPQPHMLSGHVQGRFLKGMSTALRPRRILEIGTFTGYSALCLAAGLQPGGQLHTIEYRPDTAAIARENFVRAGMGDRIILHTGNALEIIPALAEDWDLVFLDADKTGYIQYFNLIVPGLRAGAVLLADNVLFHGQVLQEPVKGKSALAIQAFNEHVLQEASVETVLLTIRDGISMIVKK